MFCIFHFGDKNGDANFKMGTESQIKKYTTVSNVQ